MPKLATKAAKHPMAEKNKVAAAIKDGGGAEMREYGRLFKVSGDNRAARMRAAVIMANALQQRVQTAAEGRGDLGDEEMQLALRLLALCEDAVETGSSDIHSLVYGDDGWPFAGTLMGNDE